MFTTRKETANKMPIYPLKKIKLNPKKSGTCRTGHRTRPTIIDKRNVRRHRNTRWSHTELSPDHADLNSHLGQVPSCFDCHLQIRHQVPDQTVPFPTLAGKPVPPLPITALVAKTKNSCWNPTNTFHDYSSTSLLFWTVSTDSNRWGRQGEREREAKVRVRVREKESDGQCNG